MSHDAWDRVHLSNALAAFGTDEFEEVLLAELEAYDEKLATTLDYGGVATNVSVSLADSRDVGDSIKVILTVSYTEALRAGCDKIVHKYPVWSRVNVTINKSDASAEFEEEVAEYHGL